MAFWSGKEYCVEIGFVTNLQYRYPKNGKTAEPPAVNRYFSNFLLDLGKIDLPRITHEKFQFNLITDYEMVALNPPPLKLFKNLPR